MAARAFEVNHAAQAQGVPYLSVLEPLMDQWAHILRPHLFDETVPLARRIVSDVFLAVDPAHKQPACEF